MKNVRNLIREIPDFPKKGISFKDITPLLENGPAFSSVVLALVERCPESVNKIAAIESRGFILGSAVAYALKKGFVPIRKSGKLPWQKIKVEYDLEYGTDSLEIHSDGIKQGERVLLVDDVLATGGTARASARLIENCGGQVAGIFFLLELEGLKGREKLTGYNVLSLLKFK